MYISVDISVDRSKQTTFNMLKILGKVGLTN